VYGYCYIQKIDFKHFIWRLSSQEWDWHFTKIYLFKRYYTVICLLVFRLYVF